MSLRKLNITITFVCLLICETLFSQKPPIDLLAIQHWPSVSDPGISNDGRYVTYTINEQPTDNHTLFICSSDRTWKKEIIGGSKGFFSADSKKFIYKVRDTLCLLTLGKDELEVLPQITSYQSPFSAKGTWLAYQKKNFNKNLIIRNLVTGQERSFNEVEEYKFDNNGSSLIIKTGDGHKLQWASLTETQTSTIWSDSTSTLSTYCLDANGQQLAFLTENEKDAQITHTIWHYKVGMEKAVSLLSEQSPGTEPGWVLNKSSLEFNKNGNYVFFKMHLPPDTSKPLPDAAKLDIWSYKDVVLQSEQLNPTGFGEQLKFDFTFVADVKKGQVTRLEYIGERIESPPSQVKCDFVVISHNNNVFWWEKQKKQTYYLVSLDDGSRKLLKKEWTSHISFSPEGQYVVYFDGKLNAYFSYEIRTGLSRNISKLIPQNIDNDYHAQHFQVVPGRSYPFPLGIPGWMKNDEALLIYDNYDIWEVDPKAKKTPINITNGYGRLHHIKLRLVYKNKALEGLEYDMPILLTGFSPVNKYNGFFLTDLVNLRNPKPLTFGPYFWYIDAFTQAAHSDLLDNGMQPLKARDANIWIVKRQNATEAGNYFITTDFKSYQALTDIQTQKKYNWLTAELVSYKQLDGSLTQGILYKPENFDPRKKYPVLFSYYESFSHRMHQFPTPRYNVGRIDIAWYVSRGYLVFTPDIHYTIASISNKVVGDAAVNSIVSAAQYLAKLPYVDGARMGIQGHSFAGAETNYLITHSDMFAAACEAAGGSDPISSYLGVLSPKGVPTAGKQEGVEIGQGRFGATLWERPDLYIKASSVLRANRVTTPLLIMHNQGDGAVDWNQSVEMYMALRRLEKKVWMLQYDEGNHTLLGVKDSRDFTIRLTQFFNHYLKSAPAPVWMTQGIPAKLKGIQTGYPYDPSGNCGKDCKVCTSWNTKMKSNPTTTLQEIETRKIQEHWE